MRKEKENMTVYVPISFPNIDELVSGTKLKPDKIRVLLHQMYLSRLSQSGYTGRKKNNILNWIFDEGYVGLHSKVLKQLLSTYYKKYVSFLVEKKLLKTRASPSSNRAYTRDLTSMHYKLAPELFRAKGTFRHFRKETISDKCTIKAVKKTRDEFKLYRSKRNREIQMEAIHEELFEMEQSARFDLQLAESWSEKYLDEYISDGASEKQIEKLSNKLSDELELINAINEGYFNVKVDQFGERMHSPLKRVSKRMRPFIYFEGHENEELVCLDICNSQLYFSTLLINDEIINDVIPEFSIITRFSMLYADKPDFKEYVNASIDGTIYTDWQNIRGFDSRDVAKNELIQILFSRTNARMPGIKYFRSNYPSVWEFFNTIKSLDERQLPFIREAYLDERSNYKKDSFHCNLSCAVQRLESGIFIKIICKSLLKQGIRPFLTVHDSVFVSAKYQQKAEQIIKEEFFHLGIDAPKLKSGKVKTASNKIELLS